MNSAGLQLGARFSLPPNSLGYCGKNTAPAKFKRCIITGKCGGVREEMAKFIVFYPYLKTISKISSLPVYSYPVIESFWLGNDLLKEAKSSDYDLLLENFASQAIPAFFVEDLRKRIPKKFIPFHLFQVLHVGVGRASGAVPFNLNTINNCMIRWGKISKLHDKEAIINLNSVKIKDRGYVLTLHEEKITFDSTLLPGLETGVIVAVHWNMVVKILTNEEENKLKYWTNEVLKLV